VDIVRLGRCTLVTTLQMYKILALNCLISAYAMSVLMHDGVKFGDTQMTVNGLGLALCFLFLSRSAPLQDLSPLRPESRVFSPYILLSIAGQFAVNLWALIRAVQLAHEADPSLRTAPVDLESDFKPSLLNTVVFLVAAPAGLVTFGTNYQGPPWMTGLTEHRPLALVLGCLLLLQCLLLSEAAPSINTWMELVPLPPGNLRPGLARTLALNVAGVVVWERLMRLIFQRLPATSSAPDLKADPRKPPASPPESP